MIEIAEPTLISQIRKLVNDISLLITRLNNDISKPISNQNIWKERLELGKKVVEWSIKKYKLQFAGVPRYVFKNEVFYCQLGFNIGSEQNGERPVLILQNDKGNINSTVTVIVPITTHKGAIKEIDEEYDDKTFDNKGNEIIIKKTRKVNIIEYPDDDGILKVKKLDYYEIPIRLEPGFRKSISGFANIAQIRTVSKKRLDKMPVGKITKDTELRIAQSIKRYLQIS